MTDDDTQRMAVAIGAALGASKPEIPAPLKWAGGIISALLVMAVGGSGAWLINSVSNMQQTLGRLDERSIAASRLSDQKDAETTRRIEALEAFNRIQLEGR